MHFDAVLVLGKELRRDPERGRAELRARAAAAAVAHRAGVPLVLSLEAQLRGQDQAGSALVAQDLAQFGVPTEAMHLQTVTHSTREEAVVARDVLEQFGGQRLLAITAGYHVSRARACLVDVLGDQHVAVYAPEAFLQRASGPEQAAIRAGAVTPVVQDAEARTEMLLLSLEWAVRPLPRSFRWQVEIWAGRKLRSVEGVGRPPEPDGLS